MQKDDLVYAGHMLDTARLATVKVHGKKRAEYDLDENLRMALAHLIRTLGEAARRISPEFQQSHPEIPWKQIVGMRHKVVHDYLHVDYDIVWAVATADLPFTHSRSGQIRAAFGLLSYLPARRPCAGAVSGLLGGKASPAALLPRMSD
jgi:uncharacterized protein with HEPN domain